MNNPTSTYIIRAVNLTVGFLLFASCFSCNKYLEIPPPKNQLISKLVFSDAKTANAALVGLYSSIMQVQGFTSYYVTFYGALTADELYMPTDQTNLYYLNELTTDVADLNTQWGQAYSYIYQANAIIDGLNSSGTNIDSNSKNQFLGEAKFIRAYVHFNLVNTWGDIPLITTTNYLSTDTVARTPAALVYAQIVDDLESAQSLMSADFSFGSGERIRPNKWAALALLARTYLYQKNWPDAESTASSVIGSNIATLVTNLDQVFIKNSDEAIWQLAPVNLSYNTWEGRFFVANANVVPAIAVTPSLANAFEANDQRKVHWMGTVTANAQTFYFAYKYKVGASTTYSEYSTILRLAEQYLIRAEARAQQNKIPESVSDINAIRSRANLTGTTATDQAGLLLAIEQERRVELFTEFGHRWYDLKRTGRIDAVLSFDKPSWKSTAAIWPIPLTQIKLNVKLKQNPGYN